MVSLLTSGAVLATYSSIPEHNIGHHTQNYLLVVLLPAGLLVWLTAGTPAVLAARRVITGCAEGAGPCGLAAACAGRRAASRALQADPQRAGARASLASRRPP